MPFSTWSEAKQIEWFEENQGDPKKLLEQSVASWGLRYRQHDRGALRVAATTSYNCPLCNRYHPSFNEDMDSEDLCGSCPVIKHGQGRSFCEGTPVEAYADLRAADRLWKVHVMHFAWMALKEVRFLQNCLEKYIEAENSKNDSRQDS